MGWFRSLLARVGILKARDPEQPQTACTTRDDHAAIRRMRAHLFASYPKRCPACGNGGHRRIEHHKTRHTIERVLKRAR